MARSSLACRFGASAVMSSKYTVPPCASSSRPSLRDCASVNVPFSYPKSSLSNSSGGMAAQSMRRNGPPRRLPQAWTASARKSLPLPDSPRMSMLTSCSRTFSAVCSRARMAPLRVRTKSFRTGSRRLLAAGIPRGLRLLAEVAGHVRRVAPQAFQPVEAAAVFGEDVEDEIAVVEEDPAARRAAFDQQRLDRVVGAQLLLHAVGDGLRLPLGHGRADDEVIGDRGQLGHLEHVEIGCLLVERRADSGADTPLDGIGHVWSSLYKPLW